MRSVHVIDIGGGAYSVTPMLDGKPFGASRVCRSLEDALEHIRIFLTTN